MSATLLQDVAARISALPALSGYAVDRTRLRDDTDQRVCLYEYPGRPSEAGFGVAGVHREYPSFQVVARGAPTDADGPRAVLEAVYQDLAKVQAATLSSTKYDFIRPLQPPFYLRHDEKNRVLYAVNFAVERRTA